MAQLPVETVRNIAAATGEPYPGRAACAALAERLRARTLSNPRDLDYLATALESIAAGMDANTALRLKRDGGRPGKASRDLWVYERVEELVSAENMTLSAACEAVGLELQRWGEFARRDNSPVEDVAKIYRRYRKSHAESREID